MEKVLVIGSSGQIGSELIVTLKSQLGDKHVLGIAKSQDKFVDQVIDIKDSIKLETFIKVNNITSIYHLASLLSVTSEVNPDLAWETNLVSLKSVLDLAVKYHCRVFWPSSIAVFGPTTPKQNTPQHVPLAPTTMYGVTKVAGELLCQYYFYKHGLDVRSLRFPGVISWQTHPGGGTTDYSVEMFHGALSSGKYVCYLSAKTELPMIYISDAISAIQKIMAAPIEKITVHTSYNISGFSLTPELLHQEISSHIPLNIVYKPDHRQNIADSWVNSIDDSVAKSDWGWNPQYLLPQTIETMFNHLRDYYGQK